MKNFSPILLFVFVHFSVSAQQFKLEEIMKGENFIGHAPVNPQWSADGQQLYFDWNPDNEPGNSLYSWSIAKKTFEIVPLHHPAIPAFNPRERALPVSYFFF